MKISEADRIGAIFRGGPVNGPFAAGASLVMRLILDMLGLRVHGIYTNSGAGPAGVMASVGLEELCCAIWAVLTPRHIIGENKSWWSKATTIRHLLWNEAIFSNAPLRAVLEAVVPVQAVFAEDAIPVKIMTVDYTTGEPRIFSNKNPEHRDSWIDGMLGSMALTPFFPPVRVGKDILMDGGYFDNLMLDEACRDGMTVLIVVDINELQAGPLDAPRISYWADTLQRAFHVLILTNDRRRLHGVSRTNEILTIREELKGIAGTAPDEVRRQIEGVVDHMDTHMLDLEHKHPVQLIRIGDRPRSRAFDFARFTPWEVGYLLEAGEQSAQAALATIEVV